MSVLRRLSLPEVLAALAGLAAAIASLAGFVPGLYRDPTVVIAQSHGYDAANLIAVLVLAVSLWAAARGSVRARLIAIGALGCLLYGYVTYAFLIVLNPVTLLYIAVLACGGWSLATGLARIDDDELQATVGRHLRRRTTAGYLLLVAALFVVTWLRQIIGAAASGQLPADLQTAGWPMNPVWVLDLGLVLPLMVVAAVRLLTRRRGGIRLAVPLLVFQPLLALAIVAVGLAGAADGQAFDPSLLVIFGTLALVSTALAWLALDPRRQAMSRGTADRAHLGAV